MAPGIRILLASLAIGLVAMCAWLFYDFSGSEILISDRMSDFIDVIDRSAVVPKNRLIAFDLDDTVFMSKRLLGTPTWFYNMVNLLRQNGAAKYEAYSVIGKIDKIIQKRIEVSSVERATLSAISSWKSEGAFIIGLTSRSIEDADIIRHQLSQIGLSFASKDFSCIEKLWGRREGSFVDGVLYSGDFIAKGRPMADLFELIAKCHERRVELFAYADDQQRYVSEMARIAKGRHIDFVGIIYGAALSTRNFEIGEAKRQLFALERTATELAIPKEYRDILVGQPSGHRGARGSQQGFPDAPPRDL